MKIEGFKYAKGRNESDLDIQLNKATRIQLLPKLNLKKRTNSKPTAATASANPELTEIKDIDL